MAKHNYHAIPWSSKDFLVMPSLNNHGGWYNPKILGTSTTGINQQPSSWLLLDERHQPSMNHSYLSIPHDCWTYEPSTINHYKPFIKHHRPSSTITNHPPITDSSLLPWVSHRPIVSIHGLVPCVATATSRAPAPGPALRGVSRAPELRHWAVEVQPAEGPRWPPGGASPVAGAMGVAMMGRWVDLCWLTMVRWWVDMMVNELIDDG